MKFTEEQLKNLAKPLSQTEDTRCSNAIRMIRDALNFIGFKDDSSEISLLYEDTYAYSTRMRYGNLDLKIFVQGSYANNTNIRQNSDVDVAIVQENVFQTAYRFDQSINNYGFVTIDYDMKRFKDEIEQYLRYKFKHDVTRGNKSIKINGNTYRTDADAVPCRRFRDYRNEYCNNEDDYIGGIVIQPDIGERIINYPEQHISKGREKNIATNRYYKKMVRIAKHMKKNMEDSGYSSAKQVSSFGVESLLWNVPDEYFMKYASYKYIFDEIINYLFEKNYMLSLFYEANGIKMLCPDSEQHYRKFIADLNIFYQYQ